MRRNCNYSHNMLQAVLCQNSISELGEGTGDPERVIFTTVSKVASLIQSFSSTWKDKPYT
jgi:hypothetical protein